MKVLLPIEFMRKSMCVNLGKERLSERLSARRKRKVYWGVRRKICCYMLLVSMWFHFTCFRLVPLVLSDSKAVVPMGEA